MVTETPAARLLREREVLEAERIALEGDPDRALKLLGDKDDPIGFRSRLSILIDAGRVAEAATLAKHRSFESEWLDKAMFSLARSGDVPEADRGLEWSKKSGDPGLRLRCGLAYAGGLFQLIQQEPPENRVPGQLSGTVEQRVQRLAELVTPVVQVVHANEGIETEVQETTVVIAIHAYHLLGRATEAETLASYLSKCEPVSLTFATMCVGGIVAAPGDLPTRLREEHPNSIEAKLMAVSVEGDALRRWEVAFANGKALIPEVSDSEDRQQLWGLLHDIALNIDDEAIAVVDELQPVLTKDETPLTSLTAAERFLRQGELEGAKQLLESVRDEEDPRWIQLWGHLLLQDGKSEDALEWFTKAVERAPHPELLRRTAALAVQVGDLDYAEATLRRLTAISKRESAPREFLAQVVYRLQKFSEAATEFEALYRQHQDQDRYGLAWANSLLRAGDMEGAASAYEELCTKAEASSEAFIGAAMVKRTAGHADEAFAVIYDVKDHYWDEPDFVGMLMELGYASGNEDVATQAMKQLLLLQEKGDASGIIQPATIDDLKQMFRRRSEYRDDLYEKHLTGKLPWLAVDRALGKASHSAWAYRTQPLPWLFEGRMSAAEFVVYSTNAARVALRSDGARRLERFTCPSQGVTVVVDWSALISLAELDLLQVAGEYFEQLLIPADYYTRAVLEAPRLTPHQKTRKTAVERVRDCLDRGLVSVVNDPDSSSDVVRIKEYSSEAAASESAVGIWDIIACLAREGRITSTRSQALREHVRSSEHDVPRLQLGQQVLIPSAELHTLNQFGLLESTVDAFRVVIPAEVRDELVTESREMVFLDNVRRSHEKLWDQIRKHPKYIQVPSSSKRYLDYQRNVPADEVAVASAYLAQETSSSLLADDRVCQALVANERPTDSGSTFGTERFAEAASAAGLIDRDRLAECYLKLARWRYRFLVPPTEVLLCFALRYRDNPPGEELRSIARYAHEAMADPGLFAGTESTDIPTTLARHLFQEWVMTTAGLIVEVWKDDDFNDASATALTEWAALELVPTFTAATNPKEARVVPELTARSLIGQVLIRTVEIKRPGRARNALSCLAKCCGLKSKEYERLVLDTIDAI